LVNLAGYGNGGAYNNQGGTLVGYQTGYNFITGSDYNTLLGYQAGYDVTTGNNNTILGQYLTTGSGITTGSNNILIGKGVRSGLSQTGSNQLNIGNLIFGTGLAADATLSSGNIGIGTSSPSQTLSVVGNGYLTGGLGIGAVNTAAGTLVVSGNATVNALNYGAGTVLDTSQTVRLSSLGTGRANIQLIGNAANGYGGEVKFLGKSAGGVEQDWSIGNGLGLSDGSFELYNWITPANYGFRVAPTGNITTSGTLSTTGTTTSTGGIVGPNNFVVQQTSGFVGIGTSTPGSTLSIAGNSFASGFYNTSGTTGGYQIDGNLVLQASSTLQTTFVGAINASTASTGAANTAVGYVAMNNNTTGFNNTAVGNNALVRNTTGDRNVAFGYLSLSNTLTGRFNTALGTESSLNNNSPTSTVAIGYQAAQGFSGLYHSQGYTAIGYQAGANFQTGSDFNTLVGYLSGTNITTGNNNVALGASALQNATSTSLQVAIGFEALKGGSVDSSGAGNVAVGYRALTANTSGGSNTAVGTNALISNTTGSSNSAFGVNALGNNTFGSFNTAQGLQSLNTNSIGNYNTAQGYQSLYLNTTGIDNTAQGVYSLYNNTTGTNNSAVGMIALLGNTTGSANTAMGYQASRYNGSATNTVAVGYQTAGTIAAAAFSAQGYSVLGYQAGANFATGADYNTLLGYQSGYGVTTGQKNIYLGAFTSTANANITTGSNNIILGNDIQAPTATGSNQLVIGNLIYGTGLSGTGSTIAGNIGIGTTTPGSTFAVAGNSYTSGFYNTSGVTGGYQIDGTTILQASSTLTSLFVGQSAGNGTMTGGFNLALGTSALTANTSGAINIALGRLTLNHNTTGNTNAALGNLALTANTIGSDNTAIADQSLESNISGNRNTAVGEASLDKNTTGNDNVAMGYNASKLNASPTSTVAIGAYAGQGQSAFNNQGSVSIGYFSGLNFATGSDYNTSLGFQAGYGVTSGSKNIQLGAFTSSANSNITTGSNNIIIGNDVKAASATASNQLNIGNFIFGTGFSGTGSSISPGNLALGTSSPWSLLSLWGQNTTSGSLAFAVTNSASTTNYTIDNAGVFSAGASASGPTTGIFSIDASSSTTTISNLSIGNINFDTDAGTVNLSDIPVDSNVAAGVVQSQSMSIGGSPVLTVYGEADGAGNVQNTRVGIGTSSPLYTLDVASTTYAGPLARFSNATGNCTINPTTTSLSCSSDARLKKNIIPLDAALSLNASTTLDKVLALRPVFYNWLSEGTSSSQHSGFIAQDVQSLFPDLVSQNGAYLTLNYAGFTPYLTTAFQEMNQNIQSVASSTAPTTLSSQVFANGFFSNMFGHVSTWLASSANGVSDLFANRVHTQQLCVGDSGGETCLSRAQLDNLLYHASSNQGIGGSSNNTSNTSTGATDSSTSTTTPDTGTTTPPVDNSATTTTP
jgi:hypothetical protein